jgi:flagellar protein FlaJ
MIFTRKYSLFAYNTFRGYLKYVLPYFKEIKITLQRSGMRIKLEEYVASFMLTLAVIVPLLALIVFFYSIAYFDLVVTLVAEVITILISSLGLYAFYTYYPGYMVGELRSDIDKNVAFASTHMATIAGTGVPPQAVFQMLGEFKEYGKVSDACEEISRNIQVFGYDTVSAISEVAQRTPSHIFKDLLWSIVASVRTGGDLRGMLLAKSKGLMEDQRRVEAKYIESLAMMAEIYSTVFVAGTVMIFVLVAIMGVMGGLPIPVKLVLQVTTYAAVPLASIGFILLVETSKPTGE